MDRRLAPDRTSGRFRAECCVYEKTVELNATSCSTTARRSIESYNRAVETLCRDCDTQPPPDVKICPSCGSPHIVRHKELHGLTIAHLDCDAFYATIEKRDRPELRDVPVIVGGHHRGVVAACCYIARAHGVHSAMPMFKALKACPNAAVIKPDMNKYAAVGRKVRAMMENLTPLVEPLSIDEAFMDLAGTEALHRASPAATLAALARRVEEELSITVSIGLSYRVVAQFRSGHGPMPSPV